MRSFQRPKTADSARAPLPSDVQVRVGRSNTTHQPSNGREREPRALTVAVFPADFVPPLPSPSAASPNTLAKGPPPFGESLRSSGSPTALTRIFVGDMQHFNLVDIGPSTSAEEVLAVVEEQGSLKGWVGTGGWMVFEVAQDFGMERPIRSFELLADVQASWNKDKMVNMFIVKLTPLSPLLSRSNIPSSSPVFSGYVEWEYKRGKWTKRFMRLRESALWLTKRENGKDEICLCSVSSFDAYYLTRPHKAPKPFTFAVKSTDNLSLFENTADYVHIFSCDTNEGQKWAEMVLLARVRAV
ncbi:hypothetical protein C8F01DRAFT_981202 [Mycena amicta]|nr:hypothetical protein C8F01DRAFT_981202 [Mycena amicta]